jgi:hypothetical protein
LVFFSAALLLALSPAIGSNVAAGLLGAVVAVSVATDSTRPPNVYLWLTLGAFLTIAGVAGGVGALGSMVAGTLVCAYALQLKNANVLVERKLDAMIVAAEQARDHAVDADRAKSRFLATMSHEIRTPLTGIIGLAEVLKTRDLDAPTQAEHVNTLLNSANVLLELLNDVLDLAKVEANKVEIVLKPVPVEGFFREAAAFWRPSANSKGLALDMRVSARVPKLVQLDSLRMRQVVFNLAGNALKFTEAGSIGFDVDWETSDEGGWLVVAVRDTGVGMTAEGCSRIFEMFSQAERDTSHKFGGTGLGLAVVRGLVDRMGGTVQVESEPGRGSAFIVRVPTLAADATAEVDEAAETQAADGESQERSGGLRILVVDDNATNRTVLRALLDQCCRELLTAAGGAEALELLSLQPFDLVFMDIHMPEMEGPEALAILRSTPGPNRDTPVVALTADASKDDEAKYLRLGFDGYVTKPVRAQALLAALCLADDARSNDLQLVDTAG